MMNNLPLTICYDTNFKVKTQTRRSTLIRNDEILGKQNCNLWHISSPHFYFMNEFHAQTFECSNDDEYVYFRFNKKLEVENEFDTIIVGSSKNGKIVESKRYGQGFLEENDFYKNNINNGR